MALGDTQDILETLALLTPYEVPGHTKRRFGNRHGDGGYVLLDELLTDQPVISAGIGSEITFDLEMAERGHEIHMFDHTIAGPPSQHDRFRFRRMGIAATGQPATPDMTSLDAVLADLPATRHDIVLKMDIEGAEWAALGTLPRTDLRRFAMMTLELHGLPSMRNAQRRADIRRTLRRIVADFTLFHVHANNAGAPEFVAGIEVCPLLELSFVRTDLVTRAPNRTVYPSLLDPPNLPDRLELPLWHFPFLPTACSADELASGMHRCAMQLDLVAARVALRQNEIESRQRIRELERRLSEQAQAAPAPAAEP